MKLTFPADFIFGTSTAAYQIESSINHDWQGVQARDGNIFDRTTDHEKHHTTDIAIIKHLAPYYRMSLMWSKLQPAPYAPLNREASQEYHALLSGLQIHQVQVMMVLHHFCNPLWFAKLGGWENETNIPIWVDYAKKVVNEFGSYVYNWNTFNEPNLYASLGWIRAEFPPYKKNIIIAKKVITNIAKAHGIIFEYIKIKYPETPVGISHNCTLFQAHNFLGRIPAAFVDWCFMEYPPSLFKNLDFFGMSYYAKIEFDPRPITFLLTPMKVQMLNKPHDDMWEYYPEGLGDCIRRYSKQYNLPIIITENGICTSDDSKRINAIKDYMSVLKQCMDDGINIHGYYHWTAWDNFEWSLGPTFKFGLYDCHWQTKVRTPKPSAAVFSKLAYEKEIYI